VPAGGADAPHPLHRTVPRESGSGGWGTAGELVARPCSPHVAVFNAAFVREISYLNIVQARFQALYGLPCWNVRPGYGSFLTMEFGDPHLKIREPREAPDRSLPVQRANARRQVTIRGEWHLWIYCCQWHVYRGDKLIGESALESSSKKPIVRAAEELDGQKLIHVSVDAQKAHTMFQFDLGSRLETRPYDDASEQWMLYEPAGNVLSFRADGHYSYHPGDTPPGETRWKPLLTSVDGRSSAAADQARR
jgi:hypothetical protein